MKLIKLIFLFLITTNLAFAQTPRYIEDANLVRYKQEIEKEALKLKQELLKKDRISDFDKLQIDFQIDTLMIERFLSKRTSIDYTTHGLIAAVYDSGIEYDILLNKYYKLLHKRLEDSDKEILKQAQRNWIKYRDSESKLNDVIYKAEYSGGGSMEIILVASRDAEITKNRVLELFDYLSRITF